MINQNNGAFQQSFGFGGAPAGPALVEPQFPPLPRRSRQDLKRLSVYTGLSIITFLASTYGVSGLIVLFSDQVRDFLAAASIDKSIFSYMLECLLSVFGIGLPFFIAYSVLKKKYRTDFIPYSLPKSPALMILMIGFAFGACLLGSSFSSMLTIFLEENFGIGSTYTMGDVPTTVDGAILFFVRSAILPAFIEEFALRGVVMQPLRRYGNSFAIFISSLIFAIMHGNLIQAPFAFIAGMAMGYAVIVTNSIWTGVIIHLINNSLSVYMLFMTTRSPDGNIPVYLAGIVPVSVVIGFVCLAIYLLNKKYRRRLDPPGTPMLNRVFLKDYVTTLPLLISILSLIVQTAYTVEFIR